MERVDGVAPSLVGREVSVRAVIAVWEGLRKLGHAPEQLAANTGYTIAQLTDPSERISWRAFVQLMKNLGAVLDDDQLVALGASSVDSTFFRAVFFPARMLFGVEEILRWAFGGRGPPSQMFAVSKGTVSSLAPGHMRLEMRVRDGYEPSRENFLLVRGAILGFARIARQPTTVHQTPQPNGADFDILIAPGSGLLARGRRLLSRISDDRIARMNRELFERYAELEREVATRIAVEAELRSSEQRYRALFQAAPLPMWVFDVATLRFLAVNRTAVRVYGFTDEEFAAMTLVDIRPAEDRDALEQDLARYRDSGRVWRHRKKDGTIIHVTVSARDLTFEGRAARLVHVFDMTERLVLEDQLRQAQKMEAIGQLAGGVAHDFNNLLMVISSYTELLLRDARDSEDLRAIQMATNRAADLTQKLLAFARRKVTEPRVLDLGEVVSEMRVLLHPVLAKHAVAFDIAPERGLVRADPGGIEQIVMNLAVNARDAMPQGGTIKITVRDVEIDEDFARANVGIMPGPHVALVVADTGVGMDQATLARAFEPFYTTKELGKGTGLGLSTVHGIVQQNGGYIAIESEPGLGTTIAIYFPRSTPVREVAPPSSAHATILVIEDDDVLRAAARDVLQEVGYHVLVASDVEAALAVCASAAGVDLVVSDITLQHASAVELARQMRLRRPRLKVLWVSGHGAELSENDVGSGFLRKPFTAELLVERVRSLL